MLVFFNTPHCNKELLGAGVFGDGFGAFTNGVLGQFTGQQETNGSLDFPTCNCGPFVVVGQAGSFRSNPFENIIYKTVHDTHGFAGNSCVWMDLLQNFIDVNGVTFLPPSLLFLIVLGDIFLSFSCFLGSFSTSFRWHFQKKMGITFYRKNHKTKNMNSKLSKLSLIYPVRCTYSAHVFPTMTFGERDWLKLYKIRGIYRWLKRQISVRFNF